MVVPDAIDRLQRARNMGGALVVLSAYRCGIHNARVGGAPRSMHKTGAAFDLRTLPAQRQYTLTHARVAGFTGFGFYRTFLHVDTGRERSWGSWS